LKPCLINVFVPLHCCQNLTLPNVPTRRLLPGNSTTAALVVFAILFRPIDPISQNVQQWLLGARNWITVIIERTDHSLVTYWELNFCWWLFTTFWYVISKKRKKSCFLKSEKNEKCVFSNTATYAHLNRKRNPWTWPLTLTSSLRRATAMAYSRAKSRSDLRVLNFVKLHCVLKVSFRKEKWFLFPPHGVYSRV